MTQKLWKQLNADLRAADVDGQIPERMTWGDSIDEESATHAANMLLNSAVPREPFDEIVVDYLDNPLNTIGLEIAVRLLTRKGTSAEVPNLLCLYQQVPESKSEQSTLWAVGNAVYTIAPKSHLDEMLEITRNEKLGHSRHQLIVHLSRFKNDEAVYTSLLGLLKDSTVLGPALEALKRFGDPRAIAAIESTEVDEEDTYPAHQKRMALKKLNEKLVN